MTSPSEDLFRPTTPAAQEPRLALYPILESLFILILDRADIENDLDLDQDTRNGELLAIEEAIGRYFVKLADKVDGIAYVDRELIAHVESDRKEGQRLLARAAARERAQKDFRGRIAQAMQATGQRRLEGAHNTLRIQANPPSVEVRQPEMVPPQYKRGLIKTDQATWDDLMTLLGTSKEGRAQRVYLTLREAWTLDPTLDHGVSKTAALPVLKQQGPCEPCGGTGDITHTGSNRPPITCEYCKGTGKVYVGAVAGLALVTDQVHLRIK